MARAGLLLLRLLARLPLPVLRAMGVALGHLLYLLAVPRRHVTLVNLALCFPGADADWRRRVGREVFVRFAQSWLDRGWLWHAPESVLRSRLSLTGARHELDGDSPVVLFAPHFMGLDAGWTALTLLSPRRFITIFTGQENAVVDGWVLAGRGRFGEPRLFRRVDGVKPVVKALREGRPLYLLPDMNFGPDESIFVPFFGVSAATVPSLPRFARLAGARVVPVLARMTSAGYDIEIQPAWADYPGDDAQADTALMNQRLETYVSSMPGQYYWVHKRFKTRPAGERGVY